MNPKIKEAFHLYYSFRPNALRTFTPLPHGNELFWTHLYSVYKTCVYWGYKNDNFLLAAILHDVVEDTPFTLREVENDFGKEVADIVDLCTKKKDYKYSNPTDEEEYFSRILNEKDKLTREYAMTIKLADRLDNLMGASFIDDKKNLKSYYDETVRRYVLFAKELGKEGILNRVLEHAKQSIS